MKLKDKLRAVWKRVSHIGIADGLNHPEYRQLVFTNQVVFVMGVTVLLLDAIFFAIGLHTPGLLLTSMLVGFMLITYLMSQRQFTAARWFGLTVQNFNLLQLSILIGPMARVSDFLIVTALLPLLLFSTRQKRLMIMCTTQAFAFFCLYEVIRLSYSFQGVLETDQLSIYYLTIPVKFILVLVIVYMLTRLSENEAAMHLQQKEELQRQRNYYMSIMDQIPVDVVTFDTHLRYTYVNKHAIKDEEARKWIIGKTNADYVRYRNLGFDVGSTREKFLLEALATGKVSYLDETIHDQNGVPRSTIKAAAPILGTNKEVIGIVAFSVDITDRKQAEDKLRHTLKELERVNDGLKQFAFITSHDLKTPLRNISTYLQLLKRRNELDEESNEMINSAVNSVKHMTQLISDIFLYTTTDAKPSSEGVDLLEVMSVIKNDMSALMSERKAILLLPSKLPRLYVNRAQALHVFSNLVSNALKYNKSDQPRIELVVGKVNGYTEFRLKDNGIGIAPQYRDKIFEIFKRLHSNKEYEGTGIGLAICKKIVEGNGGKITVDSEPGLGSEFIFTLPTMPQSNSVTHQLALQAQ